MVVFRRVIALFVVFKICFIKCAPCNRAHCIGPTCGIQIDGGKLEVEDVRSCTPGDIGAGETDCIGGKRDIIYYWKPPATCRSNFSLPDPHVGVSCGITCSQGKHFDPKLSQCTDCNPGRYSIGGGLWFGPSWLPGTFPPQFTTSCFVEKEHFWSEEKKSRTCNPWRAMGLYIDSGMNYGTDNVDSSLELQIFFGIGGTVSFEYQVDSEENYDHLYFIVDDDVLLNTQKSVFTWTHFNATVAKGHHWFRWIYRKDPTLSQGNDIAKIKEISITGIRNNDLECVECSPGRYQRKFGSATCDPCDANTFSTTWGASKCQECNPWEMSSEGAHYCEPNTPCSAYDYYAVNSTCNISTLTTTYQWLEPKKCFGFDFQIGKTQIGSSSNDTVTKMVTFPTPFPKKPSLGSIADYNHRYDGVYLYQITVSDLTNEGFLLNIYRNNTGNNLLPPPSPKGSNNTGNVSYLITGWVEDLYIYWEATGQEIVLPKTKKNVPCQPEVCLAGYGVAEGNPSGPCVRCPDNYVSQGGRNVCQPCTEGEGANDYTFYKSQWAVSEVPQCDLMEGELSQFCTRCTGKCGTPGWRSGFSYIDSGTAHSKLAHSELVMKIDTRSAPIFTTISFSYALSCGKSSTDSAILHVYFDTTRLARFNCIETCDPSRKSEILSIPPHRVGKHSITWSYFKNASLEHNYSHQCDFAKVYDVQLSNGELHGSEIYASLGGAGSCSACGQGFFSTTADKKCRGCPGGKYSDTMGSAQCKICEGNTIALHSGSVSCINCGNFTESNEEHTECEAHCVMNSEDWNVYNLTLLPKFAHYASATGNITLDPSDKVEYYFSVCNPLHKTATSSNFDWVKTLNEEGWTNLPHLVEARSNPSFVAVGHMENNKHTQATNAGSMVSFFPSNASDGTEPHVKILVTDGSKVKCWTIEGGRTFIATKALQTEINVVCAPDIEVGQPVPNQTNTPTQHYYSTSDIVLPCVSKFVWASKYGCPVCGQANIRVVDGKCNDNNRKIRNYVRLANCHSGKPLPKRQTVLCSNEITLSPGVVAGLAIASGIVILLIVLIVVFLLKKTQSLSSGNRILYDNLSSAVGGTEMATRSSSDFAT